MDSDGANTVVITAMVCLELAMLQIICLELVTSGKDDYVVSQEVDVVPLHGWDSKHTAEISVTA